MKKLLLILFISVMMISSCTKDEVTPEDNRLRITKVTYTEDFQRTFEYNSNNLLIKVTDEFIGHYIKTYEIEYDSNKKPIKLIKTSDYDFVPPNAYVTEIQWTDNGFNLVDEENNEQNIFELDAQDRIIKETRTGNHGNPPYEPFSYESIFNWIDDDSLTVDNTEFKFNKINHPYSGINLSVVLVADIPLGEWEVEWQNKYCISGYKEPSFTANMEYTVNEQNYPTEMDIKYGSSEGGFHDFWYFEYETY